jgi:hypothetical protein
MIVHHKANTKHSTIQYIVLFLFMIFLKQLINQNAVDGHPFSITIINGNAFQVAVGNGAPAQIAIIKAQGT